MESDFQNYRTTVTQPVISELLKPFYLSPHEVTNAQYREFVHWVRDSIAFDLLYRELREDEAVLLLNCTKKQRALMNVSNPDSLADYHARYGFNFDYFNEQKIDLYGYDETKYAELIDPYLFYPQAERFYKRREFDISKFVYQSTACSPTPVYPDTLCWLRDSPYPEYGLYTDAYFWHPVYDNYPVVGLTEAQIKAYCDWLQRKKNKKLKDAPYTIRVELPQLFHYEMAAKLCAPAILRNKIDALTPDPFIINRLREDVPWFITSAFPLTDPEIRYIKTHNPLMLAWYRSNQTFPFIYLNGGVSEYCSESVTSTDQMTVLGGNRTIGLTDQHENQLNTIFFQQTVPANKGSSTIGFRPLIYLDWK